MVEYFVPILVILAEAIMFIHVLLQIMRCKKLSIKDTMIYPFMVITAFMLLFFGVIQYINNDIFKALSTSLSSSLDIIKLTINANIANTFLNNNILYFIAYLFLYLISIFAILGISVSLLKIAVKNFFRGFKRNSEISYILDLNDESKIYINNLTDEQRKFTVVVLQKNFDHNLMDDKIYLDSKKVKYCIMSLDEKNSIIKMFDKINRRLDKKKYHIISFLNEDVKIYNFVNWTKEYISNNNLYNKNIRFIINSSPIQNEFIKELIKGDSNIIVKNSKDKDVLLLDETRGVVRSFDKYQALAFDFIQRHNFAKYFPKRLLNENGTIKDVKVNLFMIGFGKVNQALLKDILIQTQFVTIRDKRLTPVRLNVNVYDKEPKFININLAEGIFKYHKKDYNQSEYLELPDDYNSNVKFNFNKGIGEIDFLNDVKDICYNNKDSVNYFIISIGTDFQNCLMSKKIIDTIGSSDNNIIFVRTKENITLSKYESHNIINFGSEGSVLIYDNVVSDKTYLKAMIESCIYEGRRVNDKNIALEWSTLSKIKQNSNLYAVANIPFKLSLLGIDNENFNMEEFKKKYNVDGRKSYVYSNKLASQADDFESRDVLAFLEHERWNAFELSEGVLPMKLSDSYDKETKTFKNKSSNELYHLCLTTAKGLNDYYDYVSNLMNMYEILGDPDVIKYDYDMMDNIEIHIKNI